MSIPLPSFVARTPPSIQNIQYFLIAVEMNTQTLQPFFTSLIDLSQQNTIEISDLALKKSKHCLSKFALHIAGNLEMEENIAISGLLIAKRVIEQGLKFSKRTIHRLIAVTLMLAQKLYQQEQHSLQSYSLVSGIPMRELTQLEARLLLSLDYRILIPEEEVLRLKQGKVCELFQCRGQPQQRKGQ